MEVLALPTDSALYRSDEHAWIEQQVAALRDGHLDRLDRANLIEFLTSMSLSDVRELESRLVDLSTHVLKFLVQPERAPGSWRLTVIEQQRAIRRLLDSLPSLKRQADEILRQVYPDAVKAASTETGVDSKLLPLQPIFDVAGVLGFEAPDNNTTSSPLS